MIKLIALDMDGTLLNSSGEISKYNEETLKKCINAGIKVVLASGRPFLALEKFIKQLGTDNEDNYSLVFNGSKLINNGTKEILYASSINYDLVQDGFEFSKQLPTSFFAYQDDEYIMYDTYSEYVDFEANLTKNPCMKMDFKKPSDHSFVKMTFTESGETLDQVFATVHQRYREKYSVLRTHEKFIEVFNKESSKGKALLFLANKLNITPDEIIAFGDNDNDLSLLEVAKYKITMANSRSIAMKNIATEIAPSNDEDGVAYILNKYLF